jgi:hypothetical protein
MSEVVGDDFIFTDADRQAAKARLSLLVDAAIRAEWTTRQRADAWQQAAVRGPLPAIAMFCVLAAAHEQACVRLVGTLQYEASL